MARPDRPPVDRELMCIAVLLRRLEDDSIPTVLAMKKKVDAEQRLSDADVAYLERVIADVESFDVARLLQHHPNYADVVGAFFCVCSHVIESEIRRGDGRPH